VADDRFQTYSTGMRQRLAIARGLLHRPRLLFLDEPTRSLDPRGTRELHTLVRALVADGTSVLLTTHDLVEAEALSERVAIMHRGRILASAPRAALPAAARRALHARRRPAARRRSRRPRGPPARRSPGPHGRAALRAAASSGPALRPARLSSWDFTRTAARRR
jgi:ABC-2 type transport system ATP-binding protein